MPARKRTIKPAAKPKATPAKTKPVANKRAAAKPATRAKPPARVSATAKPAARGAATAKSAARGAAKAKPPAPAAWQEVLDALGGNPGITRRGMFGADGLGLAGKYFAMTWKGDLVAKLPATRIDALVAAGVGARFDPGMGRPMREWIQVGPGAHDWVALAEEALAFVGASLG